MRRAPVLLAACAVLALAACGPPTAGDAFPADGSVDAPVDAAAMPVDAAHAADVAQAILSGDYGAVTSQFNAEMAERLPAQELADVTEAALEDFGEVVEVGEPGSVIHDGALVFLVPVSFTETFAHFRIAYDGDGKIAGLYLLR